MFISNASREIIARIIYCGPPGTALTPTLENIFSRLPENGRTPIQTHHAGAVVASHFTMLPQNLGAIRGFSLRLLLMGLESVDAGSACDLSGFKDVDAAVFVVRGGTPAGDVSHAFSNLEGSLRAIGYDFATFPWVVQREDVADPELLPPRFPSGDTPSFSADPRTGEGVFDVLKAATRGVLIAMKNGSLKEPARDEGGGGAYGPVTR